MNWFWSDRIWRGQELWTTAETMTWTWCRCSRRTSSVEWGTWPRAPPPLTCGWVSVTPVWSASGSGWTVRPCAMSSGLRVTAPVRRTAVRRWDPEPFGPETSAGSAFLKLTQTTSSASSERETNGDSVKLKLPSFIVYITFTLLRLIHVVMDTNIYCVFYILFYYIFLH